jgi:hypothetical protein
MQSHYVSMAIASIVFIFVIILYTRQCDKIISPPVQPINSAPLVGTARTWQEMSPDEKIDYLVTRYLNNDYQTSENKKTLENNKYISTLPQNSDCKDDYDDCPSWAANGECDINPEYMLYNCKSSCKSCALTPQQMANVTSIMNNRNPPSCVYHGKPYPGPFTYYYNMLEYKG